ncbi:hypothetical protein [Streptomyces tropicalis]|uniref:hypothetical protein n=1 Tax=Streptomyces tropicalis TaxID=3034234 RepID=UPI0028BE289E|nr:hypothetical protein [Streptomyces tropicalis]
MLLTWEEATTRRDQSRRVVAGLDGAAKLEVFAQLTAFVGVADGMARAAAAPSPGRVAAEARSLAAVAAKANNPHLALAACLELTAPIRWELAEVAAFLLPVRFTGGVRFGRPTSVLAMGLLFSLP